MYAISTCMVMILQNVLNKIMISCVVCCVALALITHF